METENEQKKSILFHQVAQTFPLRTDGKIETPSGNSAIPSSSFQNNNNEPVNNSSIEHIINSNNNINSNINNNRNVGNIYNNINLTNEGHNNEKINSHRTVSSANSDNIISNQQNIEDGNIIIFENTDLSKNLKRRVRHVVTKMDRKLVIRLMKNDISS